MTDYTLLYWPIPFRGHFVRYVLAHAGATWEEPETETLLAIKSAPVADQPAPMMAPPMLHDRAAGLWLSQLPAILMYLGRRHGLLPDSPEAEARTLKLLCDAGDVLEEITRDCGAQMWTPEAWADFAAVRLPRWMAMFEETGRSNGLTSQGGHILGTDAPTLADLATAALWHTMTDRLPPLGPLLEQTAPAIAALSQRIAALPGIAAMRADWDASHDLAYCGGQIEASLRSVLDR